MGNGAIIGHLTLVGSLEILALADCARIGKFNWISGFPKIKSPHFAADLERQPCLRVGPHSAITNRHILDCTDEVSIGAFTTFAGSRSQILTHSIDISENRQKSSPVTIGSYCFVGTGCVVLAGSVLPDYSVLGAGAVLTKKFDMTYSLYGGVPARYVKSIPKESLYFNRKSGFVF